MFPDDVAATVLDDDLVAIARQSPEKPIGQWLVGKQQEVDVVLEERLEKVDGVATPPPEMFSCQRTGVYPKSEAPHVLTACIYSPCPILWIQR